MLLIFVVVSQAQMAPVRGTVKLQKDDGTLEPVADATVEPIRSDADTGKAPAAKTNKNGEFSFAGLALAYKYVLVVSAPGMAPTVSNPVSGGAADVAIVARAGDGRRPTEEEVRGMIKSAAGPQKPMTDAEAKKAQAEYLKEKTRVDEANKKAADTNKIVGEAIKNGETAFKAKDYSTAIAKFDEGIIADPEFEGTAPVLFNYKGVALKLRAFEAYERGSKLDAEGKKAELEKAKSDFDAGIASFDKGLKILSTATTTDAAILANYAKVKLNLLTNQVETYRLIVRTKADVTRAKDAVSAYEQYFAVETDPLKKTSARLALADMLREAGESEPAVAAYRTVLETSPDNIDAMAGLGLSLFNVGVVEDNKAKMQEGMNMMQKFADTAPETHPLKQSVKEAVDYLKTEQKMAPQKVAPARRRP